MDQRQAPTRLTSRLVLGAFAALVLLYGSLNAADLWVSPSGSDQDPGTEARPFATLGTALRKGRELRRLRDASVQDGVRIVLKDGVYSLNEPLRIRPEDSGTAESPTRFEAAPGARPTVSGGVRLSGWRKLDTPAPGLPAAARGNVWVTDAPVFNGRPLEFRQLWIGEAKSVRARTPNDGTMDRLRGWDRTREEAVIDASALAGVARPSPGLEMVVLQQWETAVLRIRTIQTEGDKARLTFHQPESRIEFEHPWPQPILQPEGAGACFLAGAVEFLDQPGEWVQETPGGRILYWPRPGEDMLRDVAIAPAIETLVTIQGTLDRPVEHVSFNGIQFSHTTWLRPSTHGHVPLQLGLPMLEAYKLVPKGTPDWRSLDNQAWTLRSPSAVSVSGARNTRVEGCRFTHLAVNGLDYVTGTSDAVIEGNLFKDLGGNGILLGSFLGGGMEAHLPYDPADEREVCRRIRISNNVVTDCSNEDWGCAGIAVGYAREIAIEHNEIFNVSYSAISLGWGWTRTLNAMRNNRVFANHLHHYATRMCDTAGVYTQSAQPGTIVSENSIHSVKMSPYVDRPDHWFYLYTDEGSSWMTVRDNWCEAEKFLQNAIGAGVIFENNGPNVSSEIKARAGLEPKFRHLLDGLKVP